MERTLQTYLSITDGRDKLGKLVQYSARYLLFKQIGDPVAVQSVFLNFGNARKLFRLGKSLMEYQKLLLSIKVAHYDTFTLIDKAVQVTTRSLFIVYWLIDNYIILKKVLFNYQSGPKQGQTKLWFWGAFAATLLGVIQWVTAHKAEQKAIKNDEIEKIRCAQKAKRLAILTLVKNACDCITGSDSLKPPAAIFGLRYNEGFCALSGVMAAVVAIRIIHLQITDS